jgi:hypothetical protein
MNTTQKVIIATLLVFVLGIFIYAFFFRTPTTVPTDTTPTTQTGTGEDTSGTATDNTTTGEDTTTDTTTPDTGTNINTPSETYVLKKISDSPATAFWIAKESGGVFYLTNEGHVVSAKDEADEVISTQVVNEINRIEASPTGEKALVLFGALHSPQWAIFDTVDAVWRPLPAGLSNVTWGASDIGIVATQKSGSNNALYFINLTKNPYDYKLLAKDFKFNGVQLSIKSAEELYIAEQPSGLVQSRVWQLNLKTNALTLLLNPENGLMINWGSAKDILFKFSSPSSFTILNRSLGITQPFTHITLPQKCDGAAGVAFCFIPKDTNLFTNTYTMPDDYLMKRIYSSDDVYKLDLLTGEDALILKGESSGTPYIDATSVKSRGSSVYFINRYDNYVYAIQKQ